MAIICFPFLNVGERSLNCLYPETERLSLIGDKLLYLTYIVSIKVVHFPLLKDEKLEFQRLQRSSLLRPIYPPKPSLLSPVHIPHTNREGIIAYLARCGFLISGKLECTRAKGWWWMSKEQKEASLLRKANKSFTNPWWFYADFSDSYTLPPSFVFQQISSRVISSSKPVFKRVLFASRKITKPTIEYSRVRRCV